MTTPPESLYREIKLTLGQVAIVDADNYERLTKFKWQARKAESGKYYAMRSDKRKTEMKTIWMHREVLGLIAGDGIQGDHIDNTKTLLNTRANLRKATRKENGANRGKMPNNTSGFKGVFKVPKTKKWKAMIRVDGKLLYLGSAATREEAAEIYANAAAKYHKDFARTE